MGVSRIDELFGFGVLASIHELGVQNNELLESVDVFMKELEAVSRGLEALIPELEALIKEFEEW